MDITHALQNLTTIADALTSAVIFLDLFEQGTDHYVDATLSARQAVKEEFFCDECSESPCVCEFFD